MWSMFRVMICSVYAKVRNCGLGRVEGGNEKYALNDNVGLAQDRA